MIEARRSRITGGAVLLAVLGVVTTHLCLGLGVAQGESFGSTNAAAERGLNRGGEAKGRVSEVVRGEDGSTFVRLDDGTRLIVLADAVGGADPVRQGADIQAQYRESTGGEKVVIRLRVMPEVQGR